MSGSLDLEMRGGGRTREYLDIERPFMNFDIKVFYTSLGSTPQHSTRQKRSERDEHLPFINDSID